MSITEMKTAIRKLRNSEVGELMTWLQDYHEKKRVADPDSHRFDALIAQAYSSGEPSLLTKSDIDGARRIVKDKIAAQTAK